MNDTRALVPNQPSEMQTTDPGMTDFAQKLKLLLPNGSKLTDAEALAGAQYAKTTGLDPFRGEFYVVPSIGVVPGYKGTLTRDSQQGRAPDYRYRPLTDEEKEWHDVQPGDKAVICYATDPAEEVAARKNGHEPRLWEGVGVVRKSEQWVSFEWRDSNSGKRYKFKLPEAQWKERADSPTGRSWGWVAQNRALKDCANHMGIMLPPDAETVLAQAQSAGITVEAPDGVYLTTEQAEAMVAEALRTHAREAQPLQDGELQAKSAANVTAMRGPKTTDPLGIDTPTPAPHDAAFAAIKSAREERQTPPTATGNGNGSLKVATIRCARFFDLALAFAAVHPAWQNAKGEVDNNHIRATVAQSLHETEITDANVDAIFTRLEAYALSKEADAAEEPAA
jgi:hypothetical protein